MGDEGLEPPTDRKNPRENSHFLKPGGAQSGTPAADLQFINVNWQRLSTADRSAVLALVRSVVDRRDSAGSEQGKRQGKRRPAGFLAPEPQCGITSSPKGRGATDGVGPLPLSLRSNVEQLQMEKQ
jgi:hypothetical protein